MSQVLFGERRWKFDEDEYNESLLIDQEIMSRVTSTSTSFRPNVRNLGASLDIDPFEDVTDELRAEESDETESDGVLQEVLEGAPLTLEEVSSWLRGLTRNERAHWDQWVRDLRGFENALVSIGFDHVDVRTYLRETNSNN